MKTKFNKAPISIYIAAALYVLSGLFPLFYGISVFGSVLASGQYGQILSELLRSQHIDSSVESIPIEQTELAILRVVAAVNLVTTGSTVIVLGGFKLFLKSRVIWTLLFFIGVWAGLNDSIVISWGFWARDGASWPMPILSTALNLTASILSSTWIWRSAKPSKPFCIPGKES